MQTHPGKLGVVRPGIYADRPLVEGNPREDLKKWPADAGKRVPLIVKDGKIYKNTPQ